ncbi:MAG: MBL fold metallo-hydrolase [Sellimonas intestinalis]
MVILVFGSEKDGYAIVFDPYEDDNVPGLKLEISTANEVFTSHEHGDHNAREKVKLVKAYGETPFQVTHLESFHDDCQGKKRGTNCITILESEGLRIAHLGDIGCMPTEEQNRGLFPIWMQYSPRQGDSIRWSRTRYGFFWKS